MKFTELVPCSRSCAMMALLSSRRETWQSVQVLVSAERTVCGKYGLNDVPLYPSADTVCCCTYTHCRSASWELTSTAQAERMGEILWSLAVPSTPSMYTSSRSVW